MLKLIYSKFKFREINRQHLLFLAPRGRFRQLKPSPRNSATSIDRSHRSVEVRVVVFLGAQEWCLGNYSGGSFEGHLVYSV